MVENSSRLHDLQHQPPSLVRKMQIAEQLLERARLYQMIEKYAAAIVNNEVCNVCDAERQ